MERLLPMRPRHVTSLLLLLCATFASSCVSGIAPRRTLPAWVETVFVPMATNSTSEPGLEEWLTIYAQEAFLADGRLKVGAKPDADLIVVVNITDYQEDVDSFEDDEFPSNMAISAEASIRLYEASNMDKPLMNLGRVVARNSYISDFRRTDYVPDIDAKKMTMQTLASLVVAQTLNGPEVAAMVAAEDVEDDGVTISGIEPPYQIRTARGITISPDVPRPVR